MATKGIYKLDNGQCYPTNCFPAKGLLQSRHEEGTSHWQVAHRTMVNSQLKWLFGTREADLTWKGCLKETRPPRAEKILSGAQLIMLHHVKKPSDLCSVNISHQNFSVAKEEDFWQFDSVAYINATENLLTLEIFSKFPGLRELELSLNGLRNLKINVGDFPCLEMLDLSYNNLSPKDVQTLGILAHLKVLHLTANGLSSLPLDLATSESEGCPRFPVLEVLLLDDNQLSHSNVFVSLANLRSLKQLNLDKNGIKEVPYLHYVNNDHFSIHPLSANSGIQAGLCCRKNTQKKLRKDCSPRPNEQSSYITAENASDPDRTEVVFQTRSPEPKAQERAPSPLGDSKASCPSSNTEFVLPLPELRFLSLANNQIAHEEDLLAVALFPSLTELTFYGNPFTTSRSGDPPLLTSFLQSKLGIKLVRKKVSKLEKPRIFIPIKASREIKSRLPKVRKHPRTIEAALETTFWQLWTGSDLDPNKIIGPDEVGRVHESRSFSIPYDPRHPILPTLKREERSASLSLASENPTSPSSVEELISQNSISYQSSIDAILAGNVPRPRSSLEQRQSEALPPWESTSQGFPAPTEHLSAGPILSEAPPQSENVPEPDPFTRTPSAEQPPGVEPPNLYLEERDLSEHVLIVGPEEQNGPEEKPPEPAVEEQDLDMSPSSVRSLSPESSLHEIFLTSGSSTEGQSQQESTFFPSSREELSEWVSLTGLSGRDLPGFPLLTVSLVEDANQAGPSLLPTLVFQDTTLSDSSEQRGPSGFPSSKSSLVEQGQTENLSLAGLPVVQKSSPQFLPPTQSDTGELYKWFAQVQSYALPPEPEDDIATEKLTGSKDDLTKVERLEPIFMTQVEESITSWLKQLSPGKRSPSVPEKLRGYEELLGGDPGSDFVEPAGIQQNVQTLEKALRYPLVYREAKAKLDCFQKPYVSAKKKVLRVPPPTVQKTRMERLEEILQELRKPTNVVHIPLVCILRRKKDNWREYREALGLLKEFQKEYKSAVATCNLISEYRSLGRKQATEGAVNDIQKLQSLPEVQVRRKLEESSV